MILKVDFVSINVNNSIYAYIIHINHMLNSIDIIIYYNIYFKFLLYI